MPWILPCPACDHPIQPRPDSDGRWARCPTCQHRLQLPSRPLHLPPPPAPTEVSAAMPPALPAGPAPAGFWRGLAIGVGAVALTAVIALGVRGLWPGSNAIPPGPEASRPQGPPPPNDGAFRKEAPPTDVLGMEAAVDHKVALHAGAKLTLAGKVAPFVALAAAPKAGLLLAATDDGELHAYRDSDLAPRGRVLLEGPAYFLELDEAAGRLHSATAKTFRLKVTRLGERDAPPADLVTYDVTGLLAGRVADGTRLAAAGRLELNAPVNALQLMPGGRQLVCLAEPARETRAVWVNAATLTSDHEKTFLPGGGMGLSLSPDGAVLYMLVAGRLSSFRAGSWREVASVLVGSSPTSPVAAEGGRVLLLDRRPNLQVLVVDVAARQAVARWELAVEGRPSITRSADGKQAFLGTSAVLTGQVWQLDCAGERLARPVVLRSAASDRTRLLRGPLFVTPDSRYVLLSNGTVLTTGA